MKESNHTKPHYVKEIINHSGCYPVLFIPFCFVFYSFKLFKTKFYTFPNKAVEEERRETSPESLAVPDQPLEMKNLHKNIQTSISVFICV